MTFTESIAATCVARGVPFFSVTRLGFSDVMNLSLVMAFGVAYVIGALASHRLSLLLGEKRVLLATAAAQMVLYIILAIFPTQVVLFILFAILGTLSGMRWPVVESYVSAGRAPTETARSLGHFNLAWATGVPLGLVLSGPLIEYWPMWLFLIPAVVNLTSLAITLPLPNRPVHLPLDHPHRPTDAQISRMKHLMVSSRWLLLASYSAMWVLAALMPTLFRNMGFAASAPALSGVLDVVRLLTFGVMFAWPGWHRWSGGLAMATVALPAGFFLVLFGGGLPIALAGEVLFGASCGVIYQSALYYAMVVQNASVGAGGEHESLIGLGFAIGPAAGLAGVYLAPLLGNDAYGMVMGIGPVFAVCGIAAIWALRKARAGCRQEA